MTIPPRPSHTPLTPKTDGYKAWLNRPPATAYAVRGSCTHSCGGSQRGSRSRLIRPCAKRVSSNNAIHTALNL